MVTRMILVLAMVIVAGCADAPSSHYPDAKDQYEYELRIVEYYGALGIGYDYLISQDAIVVVTRNDFRYKNKELANILLSESDRLSLFEIIRSVPLAELDSTYETLVLDGRHLLFEFKVTGMPEREIFVANYPQQDLLGVLDKVKDIVERGTADQDTDD